VVVEQVEDLDLDTVALAAGAVGAVDVGQSPVGDVGLPALVGLAGLKPPPG
jgi:hypothetical protein